jgi:hypothetical protein
MKTRCNSERHVKLIEAIGLAEMLLIMPTRHASRGVAHEMRRRHRHAYGRMVAIPSIPGGHCIDQAKMNAA